MPRGDYDTLTDLGVLFGSARRIGMAVGIITNDYADSKCSVLHLRWRRLVVRSGESQDLRVLPRRLRA